MERFLDKIVNKYSNPSTFMSFHYLKTRNAEKHNIHLCVFILTVSLYYSQIFFFSPSLYFSERVIGKDVFFSLCEISIHKFLSVNSDKEQMLGQDSSGNLEVKPVTVGYLL